MLFSAARGCWSDAPLGAGSSGSTRGRSSGGVTVDELTKDPERRSVLCTVCVDILSQLDDSEDDVRALRLEMLSDEQVPDAGATLRYDKHAIGTKGTVSPWLIRALAARALGDSQVTRQNNRKWVDLIGIRVIFDKTGKCIQNNPYPLPGTP